jgi:hypothetical protein
MRCLCCYERRFSSQGGCNSGRFLVRHENNKPPVKLVGPLLSFPGARWL